ncbi:MAG: hypothetical protein P8Y69_06770 [Gammaproteobacteria bacterium]|jgi:hypothetical protein
MITSSLIHDPVACLCHHVTGAPVVGDVATAIQAALQHEGVPVVWDLREVKLGEDMLAYEDSLRGLIGDWRPEMSAEKRAFVVDARVREGFEVFLGGLTLPWGWGVFDSWDHALEWLSR